MHRPTSWITLLCCLLVVRSALAWGPAGHATVGAIADDLLAGTTTGAKVQALLGGEPLQTAALWADCAKGVVRNKAAGAFHYVADPIFSECRPFESSAGQKAMVNFVKRNWDACHPRPGQDVCHKQYHFADVAVARDGYARTEVGTSDHDIVSAISAALTVLQGGVAPAPFRFVSKKEALRVLAHYVGDVHQPLHVGAVYLLATGVKVDPDATGLQPNTATRGGNQLLHGSANLHHEWDSIPNSLTLGNFRAAGAAAAKGVAVAPGPVAGWPAAWASDTVVASHAAFQGLTFGAENTTTKTWPVTEPANYAAARVALQKQQLVKAGARLAQLLHAVFP